MIAKYPVYTPDWKLHAHGHNARTEVFYDEPAALEGIQPVREAIVVTETLDELLQDFPFDSPASRWNFVSLLLTPLIAPAIGWANRPLFYIEAPMPGVGKSKLAEEVLGGIILGRRTPALSIGRDDDEIRKGITAVLREATDTVAHIDNLPPRLDSGTLASLLTADPFKCRLLGTNHAPALPNFLTITMTGNNVRLSSEISRRCVPIRLVPRSSAPELRSIEDFAHPDLGKYVHENRRHLLACLLGAVEIAVATGDITRGTFRMGSFEAWSQTMHGIMRVLGAGDVWMANYREFRQVTDTEANERSTLVEIWLERHGESWQRTGHIYGLVEEAGLFGWVTSRSSNDRGRISSFGKLLSNFRNIPIIGYNIEQRHGRSGSECRLVRINAQSNAA